MNKVNTLVIGAGRAGTTTICDLLANQSAVCFSTIKEIAYFSVPDLYKRGEKYYHSFFKHCSNQPIIASADTYLLMDEAAIHRINEYNPQIKFIVMLRNPVDRAYSSYNYSVNYGHHKAYHKFLDSIEAEKGIEQEPDIIKRNNLGHFYGSLYFHHLKKWFNVFPKKNFLFLTLSNLKKDPAKVYRQLEDFLEIKNIEKTDESKQLNANAKPKFKKLEQFLLNRDMPLRKALRAFVPQFLKSAIINSHLVDKMHHLNREKTKYTPLTNQERQKALEYFSDDLAKLNEELGVDLR